MDTLKTYHECTWPH